MLQHCRCIFFATNDVYSYHKEKQDGDVMNLIMVYECELKLSTKEAFDKVFEYIEENVKYYMMYKERVKTNLTQDIQFYIHGLEQVLAGYHDFHFDSNRYEQHFGAEN
ncbi:hypothetical protein B4U80_12632 [Leptotrombidium deliense]|uniref:Uncharacterized protein n=1 Tax=Leptotrombidium deliense TaxID=299467 RepID=A0A443QGJ3_9ACAR|nr:hypothetical protein B4U80_12632 [Leptotrombidium deliense]